MTGFNNRWDHEGKMADENRQKKGEEDPWLPTYRELGEDAQQAESESDKPCKMGKGGKSSKITQTIDISVLASSPSISPWVTKHDLSLKYPRCDSILADTGAQ